LRLSVIHGPSSLERGPRGGRALLTSGDTRCAPRSSGVYCRFGPETGLSTLFWPVTDDHDRHDGPAVPDHRTARRGGHGRGLHRPRHRARPARGPQVPVAAIHVPPRGADPLRARGAGRRGAQRRQHHRHLRDRRARGPALHRDALHRGRDPERSHRPRPAARRPGRRHRAPDRPRTRARPRRRHRPPGHQARQHPHRSERLREDPRLRPGHRRRRHPGDGADHHDRHRALHVARAGARRRGRRAVGHLLARVGPLRDADGAPALRGRPRRHGPLRHREGAAGEPERRQPRRAARARPCRREDAGEEGRRPVRHGRSGGRRSRRGPPPSLGTRSGPPSQPPRVGGRPRAGDRGRGGGRRVVDGRPAGAGG